MSFELMFVSGIDDEGLLSIWGKNDNILFNLRQILPTRI